MKMGRLILFVVCCMTGITGCFSKSSGDQDGLLFMLAALPGMGTVWNVTTLAGPAPGTIASGDIDATSYAVRFDYPIGIATDGTNLYVADAGNNKIRKIVISTGVVTTIAGPAQGNTSFGDTDATGNAARFFSPQGLAFDGINLFVADSGNNKIRKIVLATGAVTTIAGPAQGNTASGDTDATGNAARFSHPMGIATDGANLYVVDHYNNKIRKIVISSGVVTTIAGPAQGNTASGDTDATANASRFSYPEGITLDGGNLYVADTNNNKIRKINLSSGAATTIAGPPPGSTVSGYLDESGNAARFYSPSGITTDGSNLYIVDKQNHVIRMMTISTGVTTTIAGFLSGDEDGVGKKAAFRYPQDITISGRTLFVVDGNNHKIRKMN